MSRPRPFQFSTWRERTKLLPTMRCELMMLPIAADAMSRGLCLMPLAVSFRGIAHVIWGAGKAIAVLIISYYDITMSARIVAAGTDPLLLRTLAEFRFELRRFLQLSEGLALEAGLHPQQHQLLLQVAGAPVASDVTIAYAAERLGLKHNSTVELVDRSEREDLLVRTEDPGDRRRTILRVTRKGRQVPDRLAGDHARELNELGPRLVTALEHVRMHADDGRGETR